MTNLDAWRVVCELDAYLLAREDFIKDPTANTARMLVNRHDLVAALSGVDDTEAAADPRLVARVPDARPGAAQVTFLGPDGIAADQELEAEPTQPMTDHPTLLALRDEIAAGLRVRAAHELTELVIVERAANLAIRLAERFEIRDRPLEPDFNDGRIT